MLDRVRTRFPTYTPLNDFEIFILGLQHNAVPGHDLREWLDAKFAEQVSFMGSPELAIAKAREFLDTTGGITGVRFDSLVFDWTRNLLIFACRHSANRARSHQMSMFVDFVRTSTGKPVDCPPGFEFWAVSTGPAGLALPFRRLRSLDDTFSCIKLKLPQPVQRSESDADTFVVRDGQTYLVKRPGQCNIHFTVPNRQPPANEGPEDHVLDFPALAL